MSVSRAVPTAPVCRKALRRGWCEELVDESIGEVEDGVDIGDVLERSFLQPYG